MGGGDSNLPRHTAARHRPTGGCSWPTSWTMGVRFHRRTDLVADEAEQPTATLRPPPDAGDPPRTSHWPVRPRLPGRTDPVAASTESASALNEHRGLPAGDRSRTALRPLGLRLHGRDRQRAGEGVARREAVASSGPRGRPRSTAWPLGSRLHGGDRTPFGAERFAYDDTGPDA